MVLNLGVYSCNPTITGGVFAAASVGYVPSSVFSLLCDSVENHSVFSQVKEKCRDGCISLLPTNGLNSCQNTSGYNKIPPRMGTGAAIFSNPVIGDFNGLAPTHLPGKSPVGVFCSMNNRPRGQSPQERNSVQL